MLDMVDKGIATNQAVLTVGYDVESLSIPGITYRGDITRDHYGREVPKHAHGTVNFNRHTSSTEEITDGILDLYDRIVNPALLIRRLNIGVNNLASESVRKSEGRAEQMNFFTDYTAADKKAKEAEENYAKEKQRQSAVIAIRKKFGGNSIIRGMSLEDGATAIDRNMQIGGHKA